MPTCCVHVRQIFPVGSCSVGDLDVSHVIIFDQTCRFTEAFAFRKVAHKCSSENLLFSFLSEIRVNFVHKQEDNSRIFPSLIGFSGMLSGYLAIPLVCTLVISPWLNGCSALLLFLFLFFRICFGNSFSHSFRMNATNHWSGLRSWISDFFISDFIYFSDSNAYEHFSSLRMSNYLSFCLPNRGQQTQSYANVFWVLSLLLLVR